VIDGTFVGLDGDVISRMEARQEFQEWGHGPVIPDTLCRLYVKLIIFGKPVPVELEFNRVELITF
jgi:transcription antitermination factor NusG